jgi:hypothetical protein
MKRAWTAADLDRFANRIPDAQGAAELLLEHQLRIKSMLRAGAAAMRRQTRQPRSRTWRKSAS